MGIRHLHTFITKRVPNGVFPVDIADEVNKFKRNRPNETPIIIIDLLLMHSKVYKNNQEILLGGRYNLFNERLHQYLTKLKSLNIELIFFSDGPMQQDKIETNLIRRNDEYYDHVKILNAIDNGLDISGDLKEYHIRNLTVFFSNLHKIAKEYGELYISVLNECDQEMAYVANNLNALAIITDDTDFLIYDGNWKLWSANNLDFNQLKTLEYNKAALREKLSLSPRQMILLAALSGNDIVQYDMVKDYHDYIAPNGGKFFKIANIIRYNIRSLPPKLNFYDEKFIVQNVFRREDRTQGLIDLRKCLDLYSYNNMKIEYENDVIEIIAKNSGNFFVTILEDTKSSVNSFYFDLSKNIFMPYYDLYITIFRRIIGVLLKDKQHQNPIRKFYFKLEHDRPYELVTVVPEYPPYGLPPLIQLLYQPYGEDHELDKLRINLLCWQISSPKLKPNIISKLLPSNNTDVILTILYIYEKKQITIEEADCLLLACNCPDNIRDSLDLNEVKVIDGRDARLTFLFTKFYSFISNSIKVVGLKVLRNLLQFDGLYFHYLRKRCRENSDYLNTLLENYQDLRIYR